MCSFGAMPLPCIAQAAIQPGPPRYTFALPQEVVNDRAITGGENQGVICGFSRFVMAQAVVEAVRNRNLALLPILRNKSQLWLCLQL